MPKFSKISDINIEDDNSWRETLFLTFDLDWCSDEVLSYTLDIIEKSDIKATFFVTHNTKLLDRMRANENIELGIHPNFNFLLNGDFRQGGNIGEVVAFYKKIVPEAISVRSHALTQGSIILDTFEEMGLIYDCNTLFPLIGGVLNPYRYSRELIRVPHIFEDDVQEQYDKSWDINRYIEYKGIKVFDFHPIHIFLNSRSLDRYELVRPDFHNIELLNRYRNRDSYGSENFLRDLINKI